MENNSSFIVAIIAAIILGLGVLFGATAGIMYFSYNNTEVSLRNQAEAQRGKIEANFDAMWKIINQEAQVADEYKNAFKEIYPAIIEGRYSQGDGSLMKWIQEQNPNFDTSLYKHLMQSIEAQRLSFANAQYRMLDIIRQHTTLCESMPAKWFIQNKEPIEYTVISSTKTKSTITTGIDDSVELFNH
jgi:hypothetical protein